MSASCVLASLRGSTYCKGTGSPRVLEGCLSRSCTGTVADRKGDSPLAAALLHGLFEHPVGYARAIRDHVPLHVFRALTRFFNSQLGEFDGPFASRTSTV
jgi:hypothetical protein